MARVSVANGLTVRQRITAAFVAKFEALTDDYGNGDNPVFRKVYKGNTDELPNDRAPFAGIEEGTETMEESYGGCSTYELPMFFHFRFRGERGVDEQDLYQYYLGLVKKAVLEDHNLGSLTTDIMEESNAPTILGIADAYPGGTLTVMVKYKTRLHDPYRLVGES